MLVATRRHRLCIDDGHIHPRSLRGPGSAGDGCAVGRNGFGTGRDGFGTRTYSPRSSDDAHHDFLRHRQSARAMGMTAAVLSGFVLALVAPALCRLLPRASGWILALLPFSLAIYFGSHAARIAGGKNVLVHQRWVPSLGVDLSFYVDGLALTLALLISGVGALVLIYAGGYLAGHPQLGRLYALLLMFMASMLGLVTADNLLALFVFWELTSLASYLLVGFDHERAEARAAALQALLITGGGGLVLLAGLLLLGQAGGSLELSVLLSQAGIQSHSLYLPALFLIAIGAFTKSAQFPFHFWLPGAMQAPTPVSAYLHSATMVKAGVYLLARLSPVLGGTMAWQSLLVTIGGITMLLGGVLALYRTDLKQILAYSTVSALGTLVLLLGLGTSGAVKAAMVFLVAHALYKGALFMVAGAIDHETGTRQVDRLGGLWRAMPITAAAAVLAAFSLAGVGPVLSFIAKELVFEAVLEGPAWFLLAPAAVLSGGLFVAVGIIVSREPFFGPLRRPPKEPDDSPPSLWLGPLVLALAGVALALLPSWWTGHVIAPAVTAVGGEPTEVKLALWHGFNTALALSVTSVLVGAGLYVRWEHLRAIGSRFDFILRRGPTRWYELGLLGLNRLAQAQTRILQNGNLRHYLLIVLTASVALVGVTLIGRGQLVLSPGWEELQLYDVGLGLLITVSALAAVSATSRLAAIAALGVVGIGVALVFVLFGAPDVAMTLFLVETLTVIVFVLVFYHLPKYRVEHGRLSHLRDLVVAGSVGVLMTALVLIITDAEHHPTISKYFSEHSVPDAHGRNVVNVILVDFRALDTLGEITVLAVAGIGVFALLKLRPQAANAEHAVSDGSTDPESLSSPAASPPVADTDTGRQA